MPRREKDPHTSQNSPPLELNELIAELEAELRRTTPRGVSGTSSVRLDARAKAERVWRVSGDRPLTGRGGLLGASQRPVKLAVRKLVRWYVEPVLADQRAYNAALLRLVDELHAEQEKLRVELERRPAAP